MTRSRLIPAALGAAVFAVFFYDIGIKPQPRLSPSTADGVYSNPCCGQLVLSGGWAVHGADGFSYVVETNKEGPYVGAIGRLVMADADGFSFASGNPLKMRIDPTARRSWIDIRGPDKLYRFMRQTNKIERVDLSAEDRRSPFSLHAP